MLVFVVLVYKPPRFCMARQIYICLSASLSISQSVLSLFFHLSSSLVFLVFVIRALWSMHSSLWVYVETRNTFMFHNTEEFRAEVNSILYTVYISPKQCSCLKALYRAQGLNPLSTFFSIRKYCCLCIIPDHDGFRLCKLHRYIRPQVQVPTMASSFNILAFPVAENRAFPHRPSVPYPCHKQTLCLALGCIGPVCFSLTRESLATLFIRY